MNLCHTRVVAKAAGSEGMCREPCEYRISRLGRSRNRPRQMKFSRRRKPTMPERRSKAGAAWRFDGIGRYVKATLSMLVAMTLFAGAAFFDCKNLPVNAHLLPDSEIGLAMVLYAFILAGATIMAVWQYFSLCKSKASSKIIKRSPAMFFLAAFALYLLILVELSSKYCR